MYGCGLCPVALRCVCVCNTMAMQCWHSIWSLFGSQAPPVTQMLLSCMQVHGSVMSCLEPDWLHEPSCELVTVQRGVTHCSHRQMMSQSNVPLPAAVVLTG